MNKLSVLFSTGDLNGEQFIFNDYIEINHKDINLGEKNPDSEILSIISDLAKNNDLDVELNYGICPFRMHSYDCDDGFQDVHTIYIGDYYEDYNDYRCSLHLIWLLEMKIREPEVSCIDSWEVEYNMNELCEFLDDVGGDVRNKLGSDVTKTISKAKTILKETFVRNTKNLS